LRQRGAGGEVDEGEGEQERAEGGKSFHRISPIERKKREMGDYAADVST
jgi:hypothetical protein